MKTTFFAIICSVAFIVLDAGCRNHNPKMENSSETATIASDLDRPIIFCWFVEDNGKGGSGYIPFDASSSVPLLPDEHLFSTIEETRRTIKSRVSQTPVLVPQYPEGVPKSWRVRNLSTNEVQQISKGEFIIRYFWKNGLWKEKHD